MNENDLICTMTGQQYRAAFICKAKTDVRYYINSIYINADHEEVVSTNGHVMYVASIEPGPAMETLIFDAPTALASIEKVEIYLHTDSNILLVYTNSKGTVSQQICNRIVATYPDYRAVMVWQKGTKTEACNVLGIDPIYLANVAKIFAKSNSVKWESRNPVTAFHITSASKENQGLYVVMPTRIK